MILGEVEVRGSRRPTTRSDGSVTLRPELLTGSSSSAGEIDLISQLKLMPGISSAGDYGSGLLVDGQDASQTLYSVNGATVFFPYRFGGIFSAFNTWHFSKADFERNVHGPDMPQRLGASVDLSTFTRPDTLDRFGGRASIGLLSSSMSLKITPQKRVIMTAAARLSYIDQIYSRLLRGKTSEINYDFADYNLSVAYSPDSRNTVDATLFISRDHLGDTDSNYGLDMAMKWSNLAAALRWVHDLTAVKSTYRLSYSRFSNTFGIDMPSVWLKAPSSVQMFVASCEYAFAHWDAGARAGQLRIEPQYPSFSGFGQASERIAVVQRPLQTEAFARYEFTPGQRWRLRVGLNLNGWFNGAYRSVSPDPRLTATFNGGDTGIFTLHVGVYHQNLHLTGLSDIGLASNFWSGATKKSPRQRALSFALNYKRQGHGWMPTVTAEVYYKVVGNQPEYEGIMVDLIDDSYDPLRKMSMTRGYNAGANIGLETRIGSADLSAAYSFGVARRHEPGGRYFPGITDPGHSLRLDAQVDAGSKWRLGADFVLASGRRQTPVKSLYMIAGNVISEFGPRNSARLPLYHRIDLSATYTLRHRSLTSELNFTLINAYGHRNVEMQYFSITDEGRYLLRSKSSLYRLMPSVNYILSF